MMSQDAASYQSFFNAQNEIHDLFVRVLENMLGKEGMTVAQAITLKNLKEHDALCKMSDLAATRFLTPAAATGIVDRLIHLGMVERKFDENDRRVILLALTARGEEAISVMEGKVQEIMGQFFERISESDRQASLRIFKKLKEYLKEELDAHKKK